MVHPDFWSLTNNVVSLCQGCGLGRAAREAGLHPVPPETLPRNAKAPAAHRQRGVRPFHRLFTGLPFSAVCWVCCHIVTLSHSWPPIGRFQSCDLDFQKSISSRSLDAIFTKHLRIPATSSRCCCCPSGDRIPRWPFGMCVTPIDYATF